MVAEVIKYKNGSTRIKVDCSGFDFFDIDEYIVNYPLPKGEVAS